MTSSHVLAVGNHHFPGLKPRAKDEVALYVSQPAACGLLLRHHVWLPPALRARLPPSTPSNVPVTIAAAFEARNTAGPAISSGVAIRFMGMPPSMRSCRASSKVSDAIHFLNPSVST